MTCHYTEHEQEYNFHESHKVRVPDLNNELLIQWCWSELYKMIMSVESQHNVLCNLISNNEVFVN